MSFLAIALGWSAVIFVICAAWHRFCTRRPRTPAPRATSATFTGTVQPRALLLTTQQVADIQAGVALVTSGALTAAVASIDYLSLGSGVGRVCVIITDDSVFTSVVEPALRKHLARAT